MSIRRSMLFCCLLAAVMVWALESCELSDGGIETNQAHDEPSFAIAPPQTARRFSNSPQTGGGGLDELKGEQGPAGLQAAPAPRETPPRTQATNVMVRGRLRSKDPKLRLGDRQIAVNGLPITLTAADGSFEFPAVLKGRQYLRIGRGIAFDFPELRKQFRSMDTSMGEAECTKNGVPGVYGALSKHSESGISVPPVTDGGAPYLLIDVRAIPRLTGLVLAKNQPVVGANIEVNPSETFSGIDLLYGFASFQAQKTKTDSAGRFNFELLEKGLWTVEVSVEGFPKTEIEIVVGGTEPLNPLKIQLAKIDLVVEVQVESGARPTGLPVFLVYSKDTDYLSLESFENISGFEFRKTKLVEGCCQFNDLASGHYIIQVGRQHSHFFIVGGYQRVLQLNSDNQLQRLTIRLKPAFQYNAKLLCDGQSLLPGASVVVAYRDGERESIKARSNPRGVVSITSDRRADLFLKSVFGTILVNGKRRSSEFEVISTNKLLCSDSHEIKNRDANWDYKNPALVIQLRAKPRLRKH